MLCACSSKIVMDGYEIKVESCEWRYQNGEETMDEIADEIGEESDAWNDLYFPSIYFKRDHDNKPQYMVFKNNRLAVVYDWKQSSGKIIDVMDFFPKEFNSIEEKTIFYKFSPRFDISQNGRFTLLYISDAGMPIYVFDNEKGTAKKITAASLKRVYFIGNLMYIELVDKSNHFNVEKYTTTVLYDPQSGKIEKTQYAKQSWPEPPDLDTYTNMGDISSLLGTFQWDGTLCKDDITERNNANPYRVQLFLYSTTDKTYITEVFDVRDLVQ